MSIPNSWVIPFLLAGIPGFELVHHEADCGLALPPLPPVHGGGGLIRPRQGPGL